MVQLLQVLILFEKPTFNQIKYLHSNTIDNLTHTADIFNAKCDESQLFILFYFLFCDISQVFEDV